MKSTNSSITSSPIQNSKEKKQFAVSLAILDIIDQEGLHKLTHSKVARHSKVSRAWIYEYMGKEKQDLIEIATEVIGSFFARFSKMEQPSTSEDLLAQLKDGAEFIYQTVTSYPVIIKLYYNFRGTNTPIGVTISKYEKHWLEFIAKNLVKIYKMPSKRAATIAYILLTLRMGLAHKIVSSPAPAKVIEENREALELIYRQVLEV